jgi:hypothetical protein
MPPGVRGADREVIGEIFGRSTISVAARGAYVRVTTRGRCARFGILDLVAPEDSERRTTCLACGDAHPDVLLLAAGGRLCAIWAQIGRRGEPAFRAARHGDAAWPFGESPIVDAILESPPLVRLCKIGKSGHAGQILALVPVTIEGDAAPVVRIGIEPYQWASARQVGASAHAVIEGAVAEEPHVVLTVADPSCVDR